MTKQGTGESTEKADWAGGIDVDPATRARVGELAERVERYRAPE